PSSRVERVRDAARTVADEVVVLRRADLLSNPRTWLVEIAPDFVVVWSATGIVDVVRRGDTDALASRIPMSTSAVVDAPEGVEGAELFAERLRANGVDTTIAAPDWVQGAVDEMRSPDETGDCEASASPKHSRRATAVVAGTLLSAAVLCGGFAARH